VTGPATQHSTTGTSATTPFAAARRHRAELLHAIHAFEVALAVPARDPRWRERVSERLRTLCDAFGEHVVLTEGPEGLYAELLEHAPRLARGVRHLVREHAALREDIDLLSARVPGADVERLRRRANHLLHQLGRHRQRGADLVYEAYATDIGGET
jgi:hypothetical protein